MRENEHSPENLLRRLNDRDVEMSVLLQRVGILLETPPKDATCLDRHATRGTARDAGSESDDGCDLAKGELHVQTANKAGSLEALKACLARMCRSQQQAEATLTKAIAPSLAASPLDAHSKALRSLLSTPTELPFLGAPPQLRPTSPSSRAESDSGRQGVSGLGGEGSGTGGSGVTYRVFLDRLTRPESKGFVRAIRLFLFSILGNGGDGRAASARPRGGAAARRMRLEIEDVDVCGSTFLVERCAEFFLAMQNAMGIHPSWAELGYDSIVACREHLERFVMTKIHPLAFGGKLDGAADGSISARLRALQFLTADDLNVAAHARDDTVLALAQEELRKMGGGRCPGDIVSRVVRCCDTIFGLLDHGRHLKRRDEGAMTAAPAWRDDLDPAGTADDFLPVLIYVVLKANVPRLHSMCEYVQAFHSPVALMSRPGYCFVALRSAVEFLMTLDGKAVGMSSREFRRRALETTGATSIAA